MTERFLQDAAEEVTVHKETAMKVLVLFLIHSERDFRHNSNWWHALKSF